MKPPIAGQGERQLVPPLGPLLALREAAGRKIAELGGPVAIANTLHTSPELIDRLWRSRRTGDLRELLELVGRCSRAVQKPGTESGKPADRPTPAMLPLERAALVHRVKRPRDELAEEVMAGNWRALVKHGIASLAARLDIPEDRLRARLERPDRELALLIEAADL
jgi:hypothetical protein